MATFGKQLGGIKAARHDTMSCNNVFTYFAQMQVSIHLVPAKRRKVLKISAHLLNVSMFCQANEQQQHEPSVPEHSDVQ